jgi:uncharacterized YigZ family protein
VSDTYRTLASLGEFRQKIERSDFLALAIPVTSEAAFFAELDRRSKRHFNATHHCWAFRLFHEGRARSADAGEPSGSAGRPILSAIEGAELFDVAVIVSRWFGGVKLGTGGLSRAYRATAAAALREAPVVQRFLYDRFSVLVPFDRIGEAYRLVEPPDVLLAEEKYGEVNEFSFDVRRSVRERFLNALAARRLTLQ